MWNRRALKYQGKAAFRRNYWRSVLVGLLLLVLAGTAGAGVSGQHRLIITEDERYVIPGQGEQEKEEQDAGPEGWVYKDSFVPEEEEQELPVNPFAAPIEPQEPLPAPDQEEAAEFSQAERLAGSVIGALAGILSITITLLLRIYVGNPLEAGCKRFYLMNLREEPGEVREIGYAFDHGWSNTGRVLFERDVQLILWSLLFFIPGIVKSYEYRMIPYLLAEDPNLSKKEAFERSKELMAGCKWKAFVLDLSFLGWYLLSAVTLGAVGIFYLLPYRASTNAAMYAFLRYHVSDRQEETLA